MASLYQPTYTVVDKTTGERVKKKVKKWWGKYRGADGKEVRVALSDNKKTAARELAKLVEAAENEAKGLVDHYTPHRLRPLAEHLDDWLGVLLARGASAKYATMKSSRLRQLFAGPRCKFARLSDLSASKVELQLADWRREHRRFGIRTSNHYLSAAKAFTRWLVRDRRLETDPFAGLEGGNVDLDIRMGRRELADDEITWLLRATRHGPVRRRLPGPEREVLYLTALHTGLRASELASLTPESFDLDGTPATVTVEAAYSKHRRRDVQPLHPQYVALVRPWLAAKPAGQPLWPGKWASGFEGGVMLAADLFAAKELWAREGGTIAERDRRMASEFLSFADSRGLRADFHALRHSYVSRVVRGGASPKEAQALARHSTITLTMDFYAHTEIAEAARALQKMASPKVQPGRPDLGGEPKSA